MNRVKLVFECVQPGASLHSAKDTHRLARLRRNDTSYERDSVLFHELINIAILDHENISVNITAC